MRTSFTLFVLAIIAIGTLCAIGENEPEVKDVKERLDRNGQAITPEDPACIEPLPG